MTLQAWFTMSDLITPDSAVSIEKIERCIEGLNEEMQLLVDLIPTEVQSLLSDSMSEDLLKFLSKNSIMQAFSFLDRFRMICYYAISVRKGETIDNEEEVMRNVRFVQRLIVEDNKR